MTALGAKLVDQLQSIRGGATYYHGALGGDRLRIWVRGLGPIFFPFDPSRIDALVRLSTLAPSGRDRDIREIDADRLKLADRELEERLNTFLAKAAEAMGISREIQAILYKLLISSTGGSFPGHRESEKLPGRFGTLLIGLPSVHEGGAIRIEHENEEPITVDFSANNAADFPAVAFLADRKHEILPVTSGCRVVLVYHLVYADGQAPDHVDVEAAAQELALTLSGIGPDDEPVVLALDHQYTNTDLSSAQLRGNDRIRVAALRRAALLAGMEIRVGRIEEPVPAESLNGAALGQGQAGVVLWHPAIPPQPALPQPERVEQKPPNPQTEFVHRLAQTALAEGYQRKDVRRALMLYRDYFADLAAGRPPREQELSAAVDALLATWEDQLDRRYEAGTDADYVPEHYPSLDHMSQEAFAVVVEELASRSDLAS